MVGNCAELSARERAENKELRVPIFFKDRLPLAGRCSWGSLMEDKFELGVNRPGWIQPGDRLWRWQRGAVRQVHGYGVRKMANTTVLIFEGLVVPMARRLKGKRQHHSRHKDG
jgi:hypothetical protein